MVGTKKTIYFTCVTAHRLIGCLIIGLLTDLRVPDEYSNYLSIAILAAFDTLIGVICAHLQQDM